jgi:predicted alpha/beta superfamily hydrolase
MNLHLHHFHIPQLGRQRTIRVFLPKNYNTSNKKYPVWYMMDGQNLFHQHTAAFRHWALADIMDRQPLKRQAIIVGIDHGGIERANEYSPASQRRSYGEADYFCQFIIETLKPFIDKTYRTEPFREHTGIGGASMGGLFSFYAARKHAQYFGKALVLSPSIWYNADVLNKGIKQGNWKSKFYVVGSKIEMRGMQPTLEKIYYGLKEEGHYENDIRVIVRDKGKHNEVFWKAEFRKAMEWFG